MPDLYESVRILPLEHVLTFLGFVQDWKPAKGGLELRGSCPICLPKNNKTAFNIAADGKYHCFSCQARGKGAINLVMAVKQISFREAVELLQGNLGNIIASQTKKPELKQEVKEVNEPFHSTYDKFKVESSWLRQRNLSEATCDHYGVFEYNNPKRRSIYNGSVMLKISRYSDGMCVGYLVRNIGEITADKPKYIFPKGLQKNLELFGAWQLKTKVFRVIYLVESPFAVMAFHQKGFPAISPFGWSVSDAQVEIITQLTKGIIYLPDKDKYQETGESVRKLVCKVWVKQPELPEGISDPEHLTEEQIKSLA